MKKIILSLIAISAIGISASAMDLSQYKVSPFMGVAFDNVKANNSDYTYKMGSEVGVKVERDITQISNLSLASKLTVGLYNTYKTYSVDVLGEYKVLPKLKLGAGLSYNVYGITGVNSKGFGINTLVEYQVKPNIVAYAKYKYIDLSSRLDHSQNMAIGMEYKF